MTAQQSPHVTTATLLHSAAHIAERFESKGQPITAAEALERAAAGVECLAQIAALREADLDWADTVEMPPYDPALLAKVAA